MTNDKIPNNVVTPAGASHKKENVPDWYSDKMTKKTNKKH